MSALLDAARADFKKKMAAELQWIDVAEWGNGSAERLYFRPAMTLKQQGQILALSEEGKKDEALALQLVFRVLDEDGKPRFVRAEIPEIIRGVDSEVIVRVINAMNQDDLDDEELLGN
tara:strand:- start:374 stop:727 length:354 start_codon:yes stop_codon:yes gene_type:complete